MAQDHNSIGQLSAEAESIVATTPGWPQDSVRPFGDQVTSQDLSFRADRANYQLYGLNGGGPIAGHVEPPMAGQPVTPYDDTEASA